MKDVQTFRESAFPVLNPDKIIKEANKKKDYFHTFFKMNHPVSGEAGITYR